MKKLLTVLAMMGVVLGTVVAANAQGSTQCPLNYECSAVATGVLPLSGSADQGQPISILGFLSFDNSGNVSAILSVNENGTLSNRVSTAGTCTSGTATTPGTVHLTTAEGPIAFDFVVARTNVSIDLLLNDTPSDSGPDIPLTLGVCHASAAG